MSHLFSPLTLGKVTFRNRIGMSPMCMYSCDDEDGLATDWHLVHYGSRAVGGAGLIMTEEAAVEPVGRITPQNLGIWDDNHVLGLRKIVNFIHDQGAAAGMQLGHAGRKARGVGQPVAPTSLPFSKDYETPRELTTEEVERLPEIYARAAERACQAGFDVLEIHAAHGYLINQFLSPLTNHRSDSFGGSFENRIRLLVDIIQAIRRITGHEFPLFVRLSCSEYEGQGHRIEESIEVAKALVEVGVSLIDCSSGGVTPVRPEKFPGYQLEFARRIRQEVGVPTAAVGFITEPEFAEAIVQLGYADMVLLGRELLRNPYWPLKAARKLGQESSYPRQYKRASERKVW